MPEIVSDGDIFQTPIEAANEVYSGRTNPGLGSFAASTFEEGPTAALARAGERATQAGASWFDRALLLSGYGEAGIGDQAPEPIQTPTLSPDEYNERFAPRDVNGKIIPIGDQPMPEGLARIVGRQKAEALDRESIFQRFAATHSGLTTFAAGSAASLLDPLNAALLFMPGIGEEALAARLGGGLLARTIARLGAGAATGALFAAPEVALKAALSPEEASDYGMRDALRDILYSAAGLAALHTGIGTGLDILSGRLRAPRMTPGIESPPPPSGIDASTQNAVMRSTISQVVEGRPVDTGDFFYHPPRAQTAVGLAMAPVDRVEITAAPDVEAQARRLAPEVFARYDPLVQRARELRAQMFDPEAVVGPVIDRQIADLRARAEAARGQMVIPPGATPEQVRAIVAQGNAAYEAATRQADQLAAQRDGLIAARVAAARGELTTVDQQLRDIAATGELARARGQATNILAAAAANRAVTMGPRPPLPEVPAARAAAPRVDTLTEAPTTAAAAPLARIDRSPTNLIDLALRQVAAAREGWAPGMSGTELAAANDAVYGKGEPEAPAGAEPGVERAAAAEGATPEEAMLEQQIAQLPPEALHPEDQAMLKETAEGITEAETTGRSALETAASCLMGLFG
jgi:hypothetical protein